jgi:dTDP-glucose 4,6-dehydratase
MKKILVTGGCGFIGSHLCNFILSNSDSEIVVLDRIDLAGNANRISSLFFNNNKRIKFVFHDLKSELRKNTSLLASIGDVDYIFHVAAFSHVDRSIEDPLLCVMDNVVGTCNILNFAKDLMRLESFVYLSSDEVFGPAKTGESFSDFDRYNSSNPYSASKAGAEELCVSFHKTYKMPIKICHCTNVFGEMQASEKFIPKCISKILKNESVPIHRDPVSKLIGSRYYLYVKDLCSALIFISKNFASGDKINVSGLREYHNLEVAKIIADILGKNIKYHLVDSNLVRPGYDIRYDIDDYKLRSNGWMPQYCFEKVMPNVVDWYNSNKEWLVL